MGFDSKKANVAFQDLFPHTEENHGSGTRRGDGLVDLLDRIEWCQRLVADAREGMNDRMDYEIISSPDGGSHEYRGT
jgi:hypothetical protein